MEKLFPAAKPDELVEASRLLHKAIKMKNASIPIYVDDIPIKIPYYSGWGVGRFVPNKLHLGQRKLFLNKLQFLTDSLETQNQRSWVVYAGAAPSVPIILLSELFPKVRFLLVDPNPFFTIGVKPHKFNIKNINESVDYFLGEKRQERIFIFNGLFTDELAKALGSAAKKYSRDLLFISDIRTNLENGNPTDLDILWNSAQQVVWLHYLQPRRSMLKFRFPFWEGKTGRITVDLRDPNGVYEGDFRAANELGYDFIGAYSRNEFPCISGRFYIQPWAPLGTTETRLVVEDKIESITYAKKDVSDYESRLFYLNLFDRGIMHHKNPNASPKICFDHCYDCALENVIWSDYNKKYKLGFNVKELVERLCKILHHTICKSEHGSLTKPLEFNRIKELHNLSKS
jgi:hypothetical protein